MSLTIGSMDSNSFNTLFSSLSSSNSSSSGTGMESLLSDYKSLSSGSYGKLLKAYYAKAAKAESSDEDKKETTSSLNSVKNDADDLLESTDKILSKSSDSIWKKVEVEKEDGSKTTDYDKDKIYSAVKNFIDDYNSLVDSGQKSDNTGILTQVASMVTTSSSTATTLGKVGITINSKNHLSIDETFFKESADMTSVKSLFNGTGSYAYQVATKASMVKSYASTNLSDITGSKSYSSSGNYSINSSDLLSSLNTEV